MVKQDLHKNGNFIVVRSMDYDTQRTHFIERLKDRYGLIISETEYDLLCNVKGFHGVFAKSGNKTIGWVRVQGIKVWVLRDGEMKRIATCYPPQVEFSDYEMLRSCFGNTGLPLAMAVHSIYKQEAEKLAKIKFDSIKDAAIYFFNKTKFAPLHIDKFKHGSVETYKVAKMIDKILRNESEHVTFYLRKKTKIK